MSVVCVQVGAGNLIAITFKPSLSKAHTALVPKAMVPGKSALPYRFTVSVRRTFEMYQRVACSRIRPRRIPEGTPAACATSTVLKTAYAMATPAGKTRARS